MNFLEEIKKNAGVIKSEDVKVTTEKYTGMHKSYMFEMAAKDLTADVIDLLKNGKVKEAAEAYQGKPSGIATTIKGLFKRDQNFDSQVLLDFAKAVKPDISKSSYQGLEDVLVTGETKERKSVKGSTITNKGGEELKRTSSQDTKKTLQKLIDKTYKLRSQVMRESERLKTEGEVDKVSDLKSSIEGLEILIQAAEYIKAAGKGFDLKKGEDAEKKAARLKEIYDTISKRYEEKYGEKLELGNSKARNAGQLESAIDSIQRRVKEVLGKDPFADWDSANSRMEYPDYDHSDVQDRLKDEMENQSTNLKGKILAESLEYRGNNFWKNYIMTSIVKTFAKDLEIFGEDTKYLYTEVYGGMTYPIFEYMQKNKKIIKEAAKTKNNFLFEEYMYDINEDSSSKNINEVAGVLSGLWNTVKAFGGSLVSSLSSAISSGLGWAQTIASQGIGWFAANPVAQVAVPAIILAGSAVGAAKLINKIRRKKGASKLSKEEIEKIKTLAAQRSEEIARQKKRMKSAPAKKEPETDYDMDDDERDILSDKD